MGDSNFEKPETFSKLFRTLTRWLDIGVYSLLGIVYQIFFNVSTVQIFSKETIMSFYFRIQLIIGVYMMFVLAITILRGIVSPDSFFSAGKDGSGGTGYKLITRVMTALTIFALLMPVNIPKTESEMNSFEKKISTNGVIFGLLYSLQERILYNNTLGKLILGHNRYSYTTDPDDVNADSSRMISLSEAANEFTNSILVTFYRPNLVPADKRGVSIADSRYYNPMQQSACENFASTNFAKNIYNSDGTLKSMSDIPVSGLLDYIHEECKPNSRASEYASRTGLWGLSGKHIFVMNYMPIVSTAVGILLLVVFLGFTVDVSIRAIKLELLKLISPIPVISYMDPKGSKDSAFNAWVKLLTTTYLDLFIRVASIYFIIFIIIELVHPPNGGISMLNKGLIGALSFVFIIVGLLFFAKEAPKFIKQAMGIKDDGSGSLFGGLAKVAAAGAVVGGGLASFNASRQASRMADETNGVEPKTKIGKFLNHGKHFAAGIGGIGAGAVAGAKAGLSAKDHNAKAVREAMSKRNTTAIARGNDGSTVLGRLRSAAYSTVHGESKSNMLEREMKSLEAKAKANSAFVDLAEKKVATSADWTKGSSSWTNSSGDTISVKGNYADWTKAFSAAKASGGYGFTFGGTYYSLEMAEHLDNGLKESNAADFIAHRGTNDKRKPNVEFDTCVKDYESMYGQGSFDAAVKSGPDSRKVFNDAAKSLNAQAADKKRANTVQAANDRHSEKK